MISTPKATKPAGRKTRPDPNPVRIGSCAVEVGRRARKAADRSARNCEAPGLADVCFGYEAYGFRCVRSAGDQGQDPSGRVQGDAPQEADTSRAQSSK